MPGCCYSFNNENLLWLKILEETLYEIEWIPHNNISFIVEFLNDKPLTEELLLLLCCNCIVVNSDFFSPHVYVVELWLFGGNHDIFSIFFRGLIT